MHNLNITSLINQYSIAGWGQNAIKLNHLNKGDSLCKKSHFIQYCFCCCCKTFVLWCCICQYFPAGCLSYHSVLSRGHRSIHQGIEGPDESGKASSSCRLPFMEKRRKFSLLCYWAWSDLRIAARFGPSPLLLITSSANSTPSSHGKSVAKVSNKCGLLMRPPQSFGPLSNIEELFNRGVGLAPEVF